ncbi:hypothetical protein DFH06DRAFT_734251 [Mycena polygramma]|nr:hypothetical protein DFH06DRAFT_734251 [Mycena polygramma]
MTHRQINLPSTEDVCLPRLIHLAIEREVTRSQHETLFGCVTLPNLRSLQYTSRARNAMPETNFRQLLPSTPSLESFSAHLHGLQSDILLDVLSHIPTLRKLALLQEPCQAVEPTHRGYCPPDDLFLDRLAPGSNPVVCPLLESIELHNISAATDETVLRLIRSRTDPQILTMRKLTHVTVKFRRSMVDILPHLEDPIARGLVVFLDYPTRATHPAPRYPPFEGMDDFVQV